MYSKPIVRIVDQITEIRKVRLLALILLLGSLLTGCSAIRSLLGLHDPPRITVRSISLEAQADANNSSGTQLEFLFLLDSDLLDTLPPTSAEWFANRDLLVSNNRSNLIVSSTGLAPSTTEAVEMPDGFHRAIDLILYADYILPSGQKWYRVPNYRNVRILLTRTGLQLEEKPN